jgi:hypothetical protein
MQIIIFFLNPGISLDVKIPTDAGLHLVVINVPANSNNDLLIYSTGDLFEF